MIKEKIAGFIIGVTGTLAGIIFFIMIFSPESVYYSLQSLFIQKKLGSLLSVGSLINIPIFFIFLKFNKVNYAYGLISYLLLLVLIIVLLKVL